MMKWWRAYQRSIDMRILWPTLKKRAESLDQAKAAFYFHMTHDSAWRKDHTPIELRHIVNDLT